MAVTITAPELAAATDIALAGATRLLPVATARVELEAPMAPEPIQNEAVIRYAGYLASSPGFGAYRKLEGGGMSYEMPPTYGPGFRNSGAQGLLSPWKIRRAGVI